jgi:hypothetical protein
MPRTEEAKRLDWTAFDRGEPFPAPGEGTVGACYVLAVLAFMIGGLGAILLSLSLLPPAEATHLIIWVWMTAFGLCYGFGLLIAATALHLLRETVQELRKLNIRQAQAPLAKNSAE